MVRLLVQPKRAQPPEIAVLIPCYHEEHASGTHERRGHRFGNKMFNWVVGWVFGNRFDDMLLGYKVLSWRCIKSVSALSTGFEVETERLW